MMAESTFLRVQSRAPKPSRLDPKALLTAIGTLCLSVACAAAPPVPPSTPPLAVKAAPSVAEPLPPAPIESPLQPLGDRVPAAPAQCAAYTVHVLSCEGPWLAQLDQALGTAD